METRKYLGKFFISLSKKDAVLIFQNVDETKMKELMEILPYFPYMEKNRISLFKQVVLNILDLTDKPIVPTK